ncbi:MFS transporter [Nonomuraea sp. NPDC050556]|uniref:MFS transporter n=1 Tax=Nonomuraea sp. NPDC050556 TaxID=3364369 RepID=UPI0037892C99
MKNKWAALALLAATQFVLILDLTIVSIALPPLGRDLGLDQQDLSWLTTAYSLVFGGLLLLGGRLSDFAGRRRVFMAGMVLFAAGSLVGGFASTGEVLVAVRAVQGLAGALVAPAAMSLVMTIFEGDPAFGKAMGIWGAVGGVGGAAGVVLGGLLTDWFGWRSVFFVNVPVGVVVAGLALVILPAAGPAAVRKGFDLAGAVTSTAGLALLIYSLVDLDIRWTAVAVALLVVFVVIESRSANPLLPLGIFRKKLLRAGNVLMFLVASAMQAVFFILTLYTQVVLGYSATQSGLSMAAIAVSIALTASMLGGRSVARYGLRTTAGIGMGLIAVAVAWYTRIGVNGAFLADLLGPEIISGIGFGLLVVAATIAATSEALPAEAGLASGLFNVTQQVGISVGIAVLITVASTRTAGATDTASLVAGYQAAIWVGLGIIVAGVIAALTLLPRKTATKEPQQAAPVPTA